MTVMAVETLEPAAGEFRGRVALITGSTSGIGLARRASRSAPPMCAPRRCIISTAAT